MALVAAPEAAVELSARVLGLAALLVVWWGLPPSRPGVNTGSRYH